MARLIYKALARRAQGRDGQEERGVWGTPPPPLHGAYPVSPFKTRFKLRLGSVKLYWPAILWFAGPALLRLVVMPIGHPWDTQVWYANFADFKFDRSPYDTMRTLSYEARVERISLFHDYHAYPPGLIYIYWPIAKIYALLDPGLDYHFGRQGSLIAAPIPWFFHYFFDLPLMLADLAIAGLLWKMAGRDIARRYAWNLYPVMVIIWQFDTFVTLSILYSVYCFSQQKTNRAAVALAVGAIIKYVPAFLVPALLLYMLRQGYPWRRILQFGLIFGAVCAVLVAPFLEGTLFCLEFQASRTGGGLNWHSVFFFLSIWTNWLDGAKANVYSAGLGALMLPIGLLAVYAYSYRRNLTLTSTVLVTLLGYLAFTKIVNEVYLLNCLPLMLLELKYYPSRAKEWYFRLFWSLPLAWAIISVPAYHFLNTTLASFELINYTAVATLSYSRELYSLSLIFFVGGTLFTIACLVAIPCFAVSEKPVLPLNFPRQAEEIEPAPQKQPVLVT